MTSSSRKALPWLISVGAHLAAVSVLALVLASPSALFPARMDISLFEGAGPGGSLPAASASKSRARAAPSAAATAPAPATASAPDSSAPDLAAASERTARASSVVPMSTSMPAPAASDVLADVAAVASGAGGVPGAPQGAQAGSSSGSEWGWQGLPRKLIRRRAPEFPTVLSAMGQEIEGEARIAVAPSGIVTRVEITRSSGYIEIDASVANALRDYLFSKVEGRVDTIGTVAFRFRLEKQD